MVLALTVCGLVVALVVVGLFVFGLRRRLIQRSGGTFDCSPALGRARGGRRRRQGLGLRRRPLQRRPGRVVPRLLLRPAPRRVLERSAIEVAGRRLPEGEEELALLSDAVSSPVSTGDPARAGDERRRADRIPRVAGGSAARTASECGVATFTRWLRAPGRSLGERQRRLELLLVLLQAAVDRAHQLTVRGVTAELPEERSAQALVLRPGHLARDGRRGVVATTSCCRSGRTPCRRPCR